MNTESESHTGWSGGGGFQTGRDRDTEMQRGKEKEVEK